MQAHGITAKRWCQQAGITRMTLVRWVDRGMIKVTRILGHLYITAAEDERFWKRAEAGEFDEAINHPQADAK